MLNQVGLVCCGAWYYTIQGANGNLWGVVGCVAAVGPWSSGGKGARRLALPTVGRCAKLVKACAGGVLGSGGEGAQGLRGKLLSMVPK